MRYQDSGLDKTSWNGRIRLNVKGQVNDATYVQGRVTTDMWFKDAGDNQDNDGNTYMDQIYVNHNFGKNVAVRLGRQPIAFGNQGGWLVNPSRGFDGAQASYKNGKLALTTGYGQLNLPKSDGTSKAYGDKDFYFAQGAYDFGFAKLDANYLATKETKDNVEIYGVGLNVPVQQFNVFGEYWQNTLAKDNDTAWNAGLSYGKADWKKAGTWDLAVVYNDVDNGLNLANDATGVQTSALGFIANNKATNVTFWNAIANVTLQKNVQLHAEYAFAVDADKTAAGAEVKDDDSWTVSLNYKF